MLTQGDPFALAQHLRDYPTSTHSAVFLTVSFPISPLLSVLREPSALQWLSSAIAYYRQRATEVFFLNQSSVSNRPQDRMLDQILGVLAEYERK